MPPRRPVRHAFSVAPVNHLLTKSGKRILTKTGKSILLKSSGL